MFIAKGPVFNGSRLFIKYQHSLAQFYKIFLILFLPVLSYGQGSLSPITPTVECVENIGNGRLRAHFSYDNTNKNTSLSRTLVSKITNSNGTVINSVFLDFQQGKKTFAFSVDFAVTESVVWSVTSDKVRTVTANSNSKSCLKEIILSLECVEDIGNNKLRAHFSYDNKNPGAITVAAEFSKIIIGTNTIHGVFNTFLPGKQSFAFNYQFNKTDKITWSVTAFKEKTINADSKSKACIKEIIPVLACVEKLSNTNYRAFFGYDNKNTSKTVLPAENNFVTITNSANVPGVDTFYPGKKEYAFSVDFTVTQTIEWIVLSNKKLSAKADSKAKACKITSLNIQPYYTPPVAGKSPNIIGAELTSLINTPVNGSNMSSNFIYQTIPNPANPLNFSVLVDIVILYPAQYNSILSQLQSLGLTGIINNGLNQLTISGYFPINKLSQLNTLSSQINFVRPVYSPLVEKGATTTLGDISQRSDFVRNGYGLTGSGIKIGVLSDSYNNKGGAALDISQGDLPVVQVLEDYPRGRTDEGRAMLQIVHDVAPGASLAFKTAFYTAGHFAQGIKDLYQAGCKVIVDDVTFVTEPFFKDGMVSKAVAEVSTAGVTYVTAAGNHRNNAYSGTFNPATAPNNLTGKAHNFGNGDIYQNIHLAPGDYMVVLQWNDNVYTLGGNTGAAVDLDIYLTNDNGTTLFGFNRNNIGEDPIEVLPFTVKDLSAISNIMIVNATGSQLVDFKFIIFRGKEFVFNEFVQGGSTIVGQSNATSAISVGAVLYTNTPAFGVSPPTIASFSSLGGTKTEGLVRNKPDICAPNGVNTTVDLGGVNIDNDQYFNFFGTSASAPHVAGAAALLIEGRNKYLNQNSTPAQVKSLMTGHALDMGTPGFDFSTGYGLLQLNKSLLSFARPVPQLDRITVPNGTSPGPQPFSLNISGNFFTPQSKVKLGNSLLTPTFSSEKEVIVTIPSFLGNPQLTVYNPPLTASLTDGGYSDTITFFDIVVTTITIKVNDTIKKYGESLPVFKSTISGLPNGVSLAQAGLNTLNIQYNTLARDTSAVGNYVVTASLLNVPPQLSAIYNFVLLQGTLAIKKMDLLVQPVSQNIAFGEPLDNITFNYSYDQSKIPNNSAFLNLIQNIHQGTLANGIALVNGLALVNGQTLVNGTPLVNGQTLVNGTALVNKSALISGTALVNGVTLVNGTPLVNGIPLVNGLAVVNGQALVNGVPLVNGIPLVNGQALVNGVALVNGQALVNGASLVDVNGVPLVNGQTLVNGTALVNGHALVNGQALVNGTPLVNGMALVNGQTLVNGITLVNGVPLVNATSLGQNSNGIDSALVILTKTDTVHTNQLVLNSINLITGFESDTIQYIIPGSFVSDNFKVRYLPGRIDIDCQYWYKDEDGDGFGDAANFVQSCSQPETYVANFGDCDDDDADSYPGALVVVECPEDITVDNIISITTLNGSSNGNVQSDGMWQSFEVTTPFMLQSIDVNMSRYPDYANGPMQVRLYSGVGTSGTLLADTGLTNYNGGQVDFSGLYLTLNAGSYTLLMNLPAPNTGLNNYFWSFRSSTLGDPAGILSGSNLTLLLTVYSKAQCEAEFNVPAPVITGFGPSGTALEFDGFNDYVIGDPDLVPISGDYTISVWAKQTTNQDGYRNILSAGRKLYIGHSPSDDADIPYEIRIGDDWENTGVAFPRDSQWHHYTVVRTDTDTYLFIDGVLVATKGSPIDHPEAFIIPEEEIYWPNNFIIGEQWCAPCEENFEGAIDEIKIWNYALKAAEIRCEMNGDHSFGDKEAYFKFDDGTGSSNLYDETDTHYPLSLINMDLEEDWVPSITITNSYNNSATISGNTYICNIPNQVEWYYTDISGTAVVACTTYITLTAPDYGFCCESGLRQKPANLSLLSLNSFKNEIGDQPQFTVYPNPAHDEVNLSLHGFDKPATLRVYDHLGRQVNQMRLQGGISSLKLNLSGFNTSNGLYLISVEMEGSVYSKKLMINK